MHLLYSIQPQSNTLNLTVMYLSFLLRSIIDIKHYVISYLSTAEALKNNPMQEQLKHHGNVLSGHNIFIIMTGQLYLHSFL